jgi:hypothetical protein
MAREVHCLSKLLYSPRTLRAGLACIIHQRWKVSRTAVGSEGESRS